MFKKLSLKGAAVASLIAGALPSSAMENNNFAQDLFKSLQGLTQALNDIAAQLPQSAELQNSLTTLNAFVPSAESQIESPEDTTLQTIEKTFTANLEKDSYVFKICFLNRLGYEMTDSIFPQELTMKIIGSMYFEPIRISAPSKEQLNSELPPFNLFGLLGENQWGNIFKMKGRVICNKEGYEFLQTSYTADSRLINCLYSGSYEPRTINLYFNNEAPTVVNPSTATGSLVPLNFKKSYVDSTVVGTSELGTVPFVGAKLYAAENFEDMKFICHR